METKEKNLKQMLAKCEALFGTLSEEMKNEVGYIIGDIRVACRLRKLKKDIHRVPVRLTYYTKSRNKLAALYGEDHPAVELLDLQRAMYNIAIKKL